MEMQRCEPNLETKIGPKIFKTCLWNAAGPRCTTAEELKILRECRFVGAVVTKTCTLDKREGNIFPRIDHSKPEDVHSYSINSVGLANMGIHQYIEWISKEKKWDKKSLFF